MTIAPGLIVTPMLTMRLYAEEQRQGTFELLMTSPVTIFQVLLGKFLACFSLYAIIEIGALSLLSVLSVYATLEWGPILSAQLAVLLLGATFISVGIFASSVTENQIVAFILAVLLCSFFYSVDNLVGSFWEAGRDAFAFLSFKAHFGNITRGVIATRDVIFYLSVIALALLLTVQSLQARRWR